jgi:hypothetical protein
MSDTSTEEATEASPAKTKRTYEDLPEGVTTLAKFATVLKSERNVDVRPQVVFGYAKNSNTFPSRQHTDGRHIVTISEGLAWWDEKEQRKAEREAKKAAAASEAE